MLKIFKKMFVDFIAVYADDLCEMSGEIGEVSEYKSNWELK
jgi:hypothetical protein